MAASAAVANVLLLKKRADDRQRAALRIKFEVFHSNFYVFYSHIYFVCFSFIFTGNMVPYFVPIKDSKTAFFLIETNICI